MSEPFNFDSDENVGVLKMLIRSVPLFGFSEKLTEQDSEFIDEVRRRVSPQTIAAGSFVIKANQVMTSMYFVLKGKMDVVFSEKDVKPVSEEAQFSFGEISLICPTLRASGIRARDTCYCCILTKEQFMPMLAKYPTLARRVERIAEDKYALYQQLAMTQPGSLATTSALSVSGIGEAGVSVLNTTSGAAEAEDLRRRLIREEERALRRTQIDMELKEVDDEFAAWNTELEGFTTTGKERYVFLNGDVYDGEWLAGKMHGIGTYTYMRSGNRYEGDWANNQRHGFGVFLHKASGDRYSGEWARGLRHGMGTLIAGNGNRYEGGWSAGQMSGHGTYFYTNGDTYTGSFEVNEFNGMGTFAFANGDTYVGQWTDGCQDGEGKLTTFEGHTYEGMWRMDQKHGKGTYTCPEFRYEGDWANGFMHGRGVYTFANGDSYRGDWEQDQEHGYGIFTAADGTKFEGTWHHELRNGYGVEEMPDGERYDGEWKNDLREGKGAYYFKSGATYVGDWANGVMHGKGIYTYKSGKRFEVVYNEGKCVEKQLMAETDPSASGLSPTKGQQPIWLQDVAMDDDVREIFAKERIDEQTFLDLTAEDLRAMGVPLGPAKVLIKEIDRRKTM